jgi:hypothetical protein
LKTLKAVRFQNQTCLNQCRTKRFEQFPSKNIQIETISNKFLQETSKTKRFEPLLSRINEIETFCVQTTLIHGYFMVYGLNPWVWWEEIIEEAMRERERTRASEEKKERLGLEMKRTGPFRLYRILEPDRFTWTSLVHPWTNIPAVWSRSLGSWINPTSLIRLDSPGSVFP